MENIQEKSKENNNDDSEIDDEVEPRLKYVRMRNDLVNILQKDAASCIAVHPKFLCLGSHWGTIHILDHQGNSIESKSLQAHTVAVNQISIDQNGDFIASCSNDGRVFIYGLYSVENNHNMSTGHWVKSIAIDPKYYRSGSGRRFIIGEDKLILFEKTFLSRMKSTILWEAEGGVRSIAWTGQFVAWASDTGVRIFDLNARCSLGLIKWTGTVDSVPEHYRCNLRWSDDRTLLIGWVDTVRICQIKKRSNQELLNRELPEFVVEPVSTFQVDFYISGIAPLENQLVLLGCLKELAEDGKSQRPTLHVIEPKYQDFNIICANSLSLRGYEEYSCNDYHLDCLIEENRFFIVSPKDIVIASLYDADDRIEWLLSHGKFEKALEAVTENGGNNCKHSLTDVGRIYLDHLLNVEKYDEAGKLCLTILGQDKKLWEEEVYKFAKVHQLRTISAYLPRGDVTLDPLIYEMVLYEYLKFDANGFLQLIKEWPPKLYTVTAVVNMVLDHFIKNTNQRQNVLLEALAILYSHDGKYDKALAMYLKLKHKDVFSLIQKHQLYSSVYDMIEGLMDLDSDKAIQFFLEKERVPSDVIVQKLQNNQRYLYMYLDALDKKDIKDSKGKYHGLLVNLYADYSRDKLLPLLKRSDNYPIQKALDICSKKKFYPEMVYLLSRIGNTSQALKLMTQELNDMESAIAYCQEHDDKELWNDLIEHCLDKPEAVTFLLKKIGTYVDPHLIVERIEPSMEIPGLKEALVKMMCDYNLQVSVQEGCKKIISNDYFHLHEKLVKSHQKGIFIDDDQMCGACHRKIIIREPRNIVVFYCKHSFHEECLPNLQIVEFCVICNPQRDTSPGRS